MSATSRQSIVCNALNQLSLRPYLDSNWLPLKGHLKIPQQTNQSSPNFEFPPRPPSSPFPYASVYGDLCLPLSKSKRKLSSGNALNYNANPAIVSVRRPVCTVPLAEICFWWLAHDRAHLFLDGLPISGAKFRHLVCHTGWGFWMRVDSLDFGVTECGAVAEHNAASKENSWCRATGQPFKDPLLVIITFAAIIGSFSLLCGFVLLCVVSKTLNNEASEAILLFGMGFFITSVSYVTWKITNKKRIEQMILAMKEDIV